MRELQAAVRRYQEGLVRWEAQRERLRAERLAAMRKADEAGIPRSEIADQFGLSHQRVSAMLKR
jgi:DNA-binding transcriptional regulator LsrR (DeoR family)